MNAIVLYLIIQSSAQAQYLANEPAVPPLLEGIRFCAMEPMAGAESEKGLRWIKEVKSGRQVCAKNVAMVPDGATHWLVYENSAGQIRALEAGDAANPGNVTEEMCRQFQSGAGGPKFSLKNLVESVARQQRNILVASEAARPPRTREDRLQFALCHNSLNKLINEHGLRRILSRSENERLTHVHRPPDVSIDGGGKTGR